MNLNTIRRTTPQQSRSARIFIIFLAFTLSIMYLTGIQSEEPKTLDHLKAPQFCIAKPGPIEVFQPDGTPLTIHLHGDEFSHYRKTVDGYTLLQDAAGVYYYAELSPENNLVSSGIRARNVDQRSKKERRFLNKIEKHLSFSSSQMSHSQLQRVKSELGLDHVNLVNLSGTFPTTGTRKYLMILVNFTNKTFVKTSGNFATIMNGSSGSFKKYYQDNSHNQLSITTDIVGPYNLSSNMATYGANSGGYDVNPRLMVQEAVDLANANGLDFSQYDNDNDGNVDGIMVVHAGYGEEAGAPAETIWSHRWTLGTYSRNYDGVTINDYTTVPELAGSSGSTITGIGVIVHEFGHNLGLPDYYDTDGTGSGGNSPGAGKWDVMAAGSWNNSGNTPAQHGSYSKWALGWITPTKLTAATSDVTVRNSSGYQDAYWFESAVSDELFIVENRQQTGWDAYLPGNGLLIYHVDESYFSGNTVNANPSHQGYDIEEADGTHSTSNYAGDPFPGTSNNTSFTDTTSPNSKAWNGSNTGKPITGISESSGVITFDFMAGGSGPSYCTSKGNDFSYEWIARVRVGSLDKSSGAAGYTDYTSITTNLTRGVSNSVTLNPGFSSSSYSEYWIIWIDLNQDGDFTDPGEQLFSNNGTSAVTGTLTVPASALTGTTRMRVSMKYYSSPTSCETFSYGEVEDYTVNIQ